MKPDGLSSISSASNHTNDTCWGKGAALSPFFTGPGPTRENYVLRGDQEGVKKARFSLGGGPPAR